MNMYGCIVMILYLFFQDFCYDDDEEYKVLDAVNTAITVVAYQPECNRATQMMVSLLHYIIDGRLWCCTEQNSIILFLS